MLTGNETMISSAYYQVNNGGDIAALFGVCKALIEADDALKASHQSRVAGDDGTPKDPDNAAMVDFAASIAAADNKHVLDHDFIKEHTTASRNSPTPHAAIGGRSWSGFRASAVMR